MKKRYMRETEDVKMKGMKLPIIKTDKFILRSFRKGDEKSLQENINNKNIAKFTSTIRHPYNIRDAKNWIDRNLKNAKEKNPKKINFVIEKNGEVAGSVGLTKIENGHKAEMGYWLAEKYWGAGIMTRAVKLVAEYGFKKLGLRKIYASVYSFNKGSQKVLKKSGFKLEGILSKHHKKDGKLIDLHVFGRLK